MGIKTVPQPPYSPDLAPWDFWLFPKLRGCCYETIEEMKEAVMKVIDMLTQEDFHGAFQKLLKWYNKCIATGGEYFDGDKSFMCVLSIKVPIWKKSGNLFNDPRSLKSGFVKNKKWLLKKDPDKIIFFTFINIIEKIVPFPLYKQLNNLMAIRFGMHI